MRLRIVAAITPVTVIAGMVFPGAAEALVVVCAIVVLVLAVYDRRALGIAVFSCLVCATVATLGSTIYDDPLADLFVQVAALLIVCAVIGGLLRGDIGAGLRIVADCARRDGTRAGLKCLSQLFKTHLYVLRSAGRISVGSGTAIDRGFAYIGPGRLCVGDESYIGCYGVMHGPGDVTIGSSTKIGHRVSIGAGTSVLIGNACTIADGVSFGDTNESLGGIIIEDGCSIGARSVILDGITIEARSVIPAGTLVCENFPLASP